jgi:hypothetical protein
VTADRPRPCPARRTALGWLLVGPGLALAGCTVGRSGARTEAPAGPTAPVADQQAAGRAVLAARARLAALPALSAERPDLGPLVGAIETDHRAHLAALGVSASGSASASPSGAGSASASASAAPTATATATAAGSAAATAAGSVSVPATIGAEWRAAQQALDDVAITTPATAGLLARIAAARAVHADLLAAASAAAAPADLVPTPTTSPGPTSSPTGSPAGSPTETATGSPTGTAVPTTNAVGLDGVAAAALSSQLAGEHAAVFAYGLITARSSGARQTTARALWQAHRARRDALESRLAEAGLSPPAAEPAYDVGPVPTTPDQVNTLAARVEDGLAAVALGVVTTTTGQVRSDAAADLIRAARRAAGWRGTAVPLPG